MANKSVPLTFGLASRSQAPAKIAITGVSGSGKTYSAIQLALGLADKIAVLDLEGASASIYANLGTFHIAALRPPFTVGAVLEGIEQAVVGGYEALVIDSLSPVWRQLLAEKSALDAKSSNAYANWKPISEQYTALVQAIIDCPIHVITTFRCKTAYLQAHENGRPVIKRIGTEIEFRDGIEHEFSSVLQLDRDTHSASALKDRTGLFTGRSGQISRSTGVKLRKWLTEVDPQLSED